jgi:hypothetical protein
MTLGLRRCRTIEFDSQYLTRSNTLCDNDGVRRRMQPSAPASPTAPGSEGPSTSGTAACAANYASGCPHTATSTVVGTKCWLYPGGGSNECRHSTSLTACDWFLRNITDARSRVDRMF